MRYDKIKSLTADTDRQEELFMKRTKTAVRLLLAMSLILLFTSCVYAGKGPQDQEHKYPGYLELVKWNDLNDRKLIFPFNLNRTVTVPGLSYNQRTNTLTMRNYRSGEYGLTCANMGDDFKIRLIGSNEVAYLMYVSESDYNTNLTIKGKGSLVVNKDRNSNGIAGVSEYYALNLKLTIKKPAKVTAYSGTARNSYSIAFFHTKYTMKTVFKPYSNKSIVFIDILNSGPGKTYKTNKSPVVLK